MKKNNARPKSAGGKPDAKNASSGGKAGAKKKPASANNGGRKGGNSNTSGKQGKTNGNQGVKSTTRTIQSNDNIQKTTPIRPNTARAVFDEGSRILNASEMYAYVSSDIKTSSGLKSNFLRHSYVGLAPYPRKIEVVNKVKKQYTYVNINKFLLALQTTAKNPYFFSNALNNSVTMGPRDASDEISYAPEVKGTGPDGTGYVPKTRGKPALLAKGTRQTNCFAVMLAEFNSIEQDIIQTIFESKAQIAERNKNLRVFLLDVCKGFISDTNKATAIEKYKQYVNSETGFVRKNVVAVNQFPWEPLNIDDNCDVLNRKMSEIKTTCGTVFNTQEEQEIDKLIDVLRTIYSMHKDLVRVYGNLTHSELVTLIKRVNNIDSNTQIEIHLQRMFHERIMMFYTIVHTFFELMFGTNKVVRECAGIFTTKCVTAVVKSQTDNINYDITQTGYIHKFGEGLELFSKKFSLDDIKKNIAGMKPMNLTTPDIRSAFKSMLSDKVDERRSKGSTELYDDMWNSMNLFFSTYNDNMKIAIQEEVFKLFAAEYTHSNDSIKAMRDSNILFSTSAIAVTHLNQQGVCRNEQTQKELLRFVENKQKNLVGDDVDITIDFGLYDTFTNLLIHSTNKNVAYWINLVELNDSSLKNVNEFSESLGTSGVAYNTLLQVPQLFNTPAGKPPTSKSTVSAFESKVLAARQDFITTAVQNVKNTKIRSYISKYTQKSFGAFIQGSDFRDVVTRDTSK